ncbi:MAG: twin-arginine translocation signal domain-containing protein [Rhodobacterales bacterium]
MSRRRLIKGVAAAGLAMPFVNLRGP